MGLAGHRSVTAVPPAAEAYFKTLIQDIESQRSAARSNAAAAAAAAAKGKGGGGVRLVMDTDVGGRDMSPVTTPVGMRGGMGAGSPQRAQTPVFWEGGEDGAEG